jgi:hypothetical protein
VGVARFGDCSLATFVAADRFTGNQPKISHKLAGMIEALESPEFGNRDHCRQELEAFESHVSASTGPSRNAGFAPGRLLRAAALTTIEWTSLALFDHHLAMKIAIIDAVKKSDCLPFMPLAMR